MEAAHAVLVVTAFFAALDDLDEQLGTALNSASLKLTGDEQVGLATGAHAVSRSARLAELAGMLIAPKVIPGLGEGWADRGSDLVTFYRDLAERVRKFAVGTAAWDERNQTIRDRWTRAIIQELPQGALARYEEQLRRLAGDFPEFAFWAHRVGVRTVLNEVYAVQQNAATVGRELRRLTDLINAMPGASPSRVRQELFEQYRKYVEEPIAAAGYIPEEISLPTLRALYVNPSYRVLRRRFRGDGSSAGAEWITEIGWREEPRDHDLWALVAAHLISTDSGRVPLVLLGQPGAGKSVFTQMLAAELDPNDYLVVRVDLRTVPVDADIQRQIEAALDGLTGRGVRWPELADQAGDAQPVILLDGFDELLQASGVGQFDFLERVQAFQDREDKKGRPVAVVVTSRTAVANQVRYPDGTVVVRLEEFDDNQVGRWLTTWNEANPNRALAARTALGQGDLARQPLLLFMLALFYSGGGELTPGISTAQLYERLFFSFVERDVIKRHGRYSDEDRRRAAQRELDLLSMVAFAMFNRGQQSVADNDLRADLYALNDENQPPTSPEQPAGALDSVQKLAGRFFFKLFVQQARAMYGQQAQHSSYEFLHASFGEFLVARWVVGELTRLAEVARRGAADVYPKPPDENLLQAMLSMAVLSTREQRVLGFLSDLLTGSSSAEPADPAELAELRTLLTELFRTCLQPRRQGRYDRYKPIPQTAPGAYAQYSANLLLLLLLVADAEGRVSGKPERTWLTLVELFGADSGGVEPSQWYSITRLWHAQLTTKEWISLVDLIRLVPADPAAAGSPRELRVTRWRSEDYDRPSSGRTMLGLPPNRMLDAQFDFGNPAGRAIREANLLGCLGYQNICAALLPYQREMGWVHHAVPVEQGGAAANAMKLLVAPVEDMPAQERVQCYTRVLDEDIGLRQSRLILDQLRDDLRRLPPAGLAAIVPKIRGRVWMNFSAYLDILAHINKTHREGIQLSPELLELLDLLDPRDLLDRLGLLGLLDPRDPRDLSDLFGLRDERGLSDLGGPHDLSSLSGPNDLSGLHDLSALSDLNGLSGLSDLHDLSDLLGVLGLRDPRGRLDTRELVGLLGVRELLGARELLALRDLLGLLGLFDKRGLLTAVMQTVLWTGMAERGLPMKEPPYLWGIDSRRLERLISAVPDFVARTRRSAAERGFRDPFSAGSGSAGGRKS